MNTITYTYKDFCDKRQKFLEQLGELLTLAYGTPDYKVIIEHIANLTHNLDLQHDRFVSGLWQ
jgi:predicted TIM-barrel fold metal-dependent hydrolase